MKKQSNDATEKPAEIDNDFVFVDCRILPADFKSKLPHIDGGIFKCSRTFAVSALGLTSKDL